MKNVVGIAWRGLLIDMVSNAALVIGGRLASMTGLNLSVANKLLARLLRNKDRT